MKQTACIINVGAELLKGQTQNTGLSIVATFLRKKGISTIRNIVVGDNVDAIQAALSSCAETWIVLTGGLGPTHDDVTKQAVAGFYGMRLVKDAAVLRRVETVYAARGERMPEICRKLADVPEKATVLSNDVGTAPGFLMTHDNRKIALLPGPPEEIQAVLAGLESMFPGNAPVHKGGFLLLGIGEAALENTMEDMYAAHPDVVITPYARFGAVRYVFTSHEENALKKALCDFHDRYRDHIYGDDEHTIEDRVVNALEARHFTVSFAESCTGGRIASRLTSVPGASRVFTRAYVTYSDTAKTEMLDVDRKLIEKYGAVSEETVAAMSANALQKSGADVALAVSGIAGPTGARPEKPVGTVFFALADKNGIHTEMKRFTGNRDSIQEHACAFGLYIIARRLRDA